MKLTETSQSVNDAAELIRELNYQMKECQYMLYRIHRENMCIPVFIGNLDGENIEIMSINFSVKNGSLEATNMRQIGMQSNFAKLQEKVSNLI